MSTTGNGLTQEQFDAQAAADKRVAILRDVIEHLKAEKIVARRCVYLLSPFAGKVLTTEVGLAPDALPVCQACAVGSVFLACVRRFDALAPDAVGDGEDSEGMRAYLSAYFAREQLSMMEAAFECDADFATGGNGDESVDLDEEAWWAEDFGRRFNYDDDRLVAIMENAIENNGEFHPGTHLHEEQGQ